MVPGTFERIDKHASWRGFLIGDAPETLAGRAAPVGLLGFLTAIPLGLEQAADMQRRGLVLAFLISLRHPKEPLFRDTLQELEKDRQWLSRKEKSKN